MEITWHTVLNTEHCSAGINIKELKEYLDFLGYKYFSWNGCIYEYNPSKGCLECPVMKNDGSEMQMTVLDL